MMKTPLCEACDAQGFCGRLTSNVVMRKELTGNFIGDVRRFMAALDISRDAWVPHLIAGYRDYPGRIIHPNGCELRLNTHLLTGRSVRYWYRDLCEPIPDGVTPHVRIEARARFIVLATILRAMHPVAAIGWGTKNPPITDGGVRPLPPSADDGCPYRTFAISSSAGNTSPGEDWY